MSVAVFGPKVKVVYHFSTATKDDRNGGLQNLDFAAVMTQPVFEAPGKNSQNNVC
jgi:hypothetical protein